MCGGSLDITDDISVTTCEYCGTKQTVPKSKDEVKKTFGFSKRLTNNRMEKKQKTKYGLEFLNTKISTTLYFVCLLLNVFFFIKTISVFPPIEWWSLYLFLQILTLLVPTLIVFKKPIKKVAALIVHTLGTFLCLWLALGFGDLYAMIIDGYYLLTILISLTNLVLLTLICCTRKVVREDTIKQKNAGCFLIALIISIVISVALSVGGMKFFDYQFAKIFYNSGAYEYADEYFNYIGDYKDTADYKKELQYIKVESLYKSHQYSEAIFTLRELGDFPDSKGLLEKIQSEMNRIASEEIDPTKYIECTVEELYRNPQKYHGKKVSLTSLKVLCNFEDKAWSLMAHYNALLCESDETNDGSSTTGNTWYGYYSDYLLPYDIPYVGVQAYGGPYISEGREIITVYGTFTYNTGKSEGDRISGEPHVYNIVADCCIE